jgi:hypothetical protein
MPAQKKNEREIGKPKFGQSRTFISLMRDRFPFWRKLRNTEKEGTNHATSRIPKK